MSGLHVYCVVTGDERPPARLIGVEGRPIAVWAASGLGAWASELDAPPPADAERLRAHHEVVLAASRAGDTLPVRFGQWLPDAPALTGWLQREQGHMTSALEHVRGAVEFGVRVLGEDEEAPAESPEPDAVAPREYLRALARRRAVKREALQRRDSFVRRLWSAVGGFAREQCVIPSAPGDLAAVAHLVDRVQVGPYREALGRFFQGQASIRAVVTGPWPPWSFVT